MTWSYVIDNFQCGYRLSRWTSASLYKPHTMTTDMVYDMIRYTITSTLCCPYSHSSFASRVAAGIEININHFYRQDAILVTQPATLSTEGLNHVKTRSSTIAQKLHRDSRKSRQKMVKNMADFCENHKNHGKNTAKTRH